MKLNIKNQNQKQTQLTLYKKKYAKRSDTSDTISELNKYLNDHEELDRDQDQLLEDSLRQESESVFHSKVFTSESIPHEFTSSNLKHSPTKSLIFIINRSTNSDINILNFHRQGLQNLFFNTTTHTKTQSQLLYFSFSPNFNNLSTHSQRFERICKKLSLSNISNNLFSETAFKNGDSKNTSVDSSYIHNSQKNMHFQSK